MIGLSGKEDGQTRFKINCFLRKADCLESSAVSLIGESRVCFIDSMAGDLPSVAEGHKNEQL